MDRVPEQMFMRGEFLSSLVKQGIITSPGDLRLWVQEMSSLWRIMYPEDSQTPPAAPQARRQQPASGGRGAPRGGGGKPYGGPAVDSATIPAADLSMMSQWAHEPIRLGKNKPCELTGKSWADTTWGEVGNNMGDLSESDYSYLGFLAERLDNKTDLSKTVTARAKALMAEETPFP